MAVREVFDPFKLAPPEIFTNILDILDQDDRLDLVMTSPAAAFIVASFYGLKTFGKAFSVGRRLHVSAPLARCNVVVKPCLRSLEFEAALDSLNRVDNIVGSMPASFGDVVVVVVKDRQQGLEFSQFVAEKAPAKFAIHMNTGGRLTSVEAKQLAVRTKINLVIVQETDVIRFNVERAIGLSTTYKNIWDLVATGSRFTTLVCQVATDLDDFEEVMSFLRRFDLTNVPPEDLVTKPWVPGRLFF